MPQLLVTTVYEGAPIGDLVPGRPVPGMPVDVGNPTHGIVSATTGDDGSCAVEIADVGEWSVSVNTTVAEGRLRAFRTARVAGPFALLALPVRLQVD